MVTDNPNLISRKAMEAMQNTGGSGEPLLSEILQKVKDELIEEKQKLADKKALVFLINLGKTKNPSNLKGKRHRKG